MKRLRKTLLMATLSAFFCGMFGCSNMPEFTADDIRSISISCGHMDYSHSYCFYIRKEENKWLFDAEFATDTQSPRVEFEACPIATQDVKELLATICNQKATEKFWQYKEPKLKVQALDETTYYTSILFTNGKSLGVPMLISSETEDCFYRLAKKYANAKTNDIQNNLEEYKNE